VDIITSLTGLNALHWIINTWTRTRKDHQLKRKATFNQNNFLLNSSTTHEFLFGALAELVDNSR
jgi:hypothetical protein